MGAVESIPNPDARTLRTMEFAGIQLKDVAKFWKKFRRFDKNLSGTIDIDEFYNLIHEKRSIFGDGLFELIDVNHSGALDFGEFFQAIVTYCLFEKTEVLKYCFYIFDRDKNGYIERDELKIMINVLYHISPPDEVTGNTKTAIEKLDINGDGKIDFDEFMNFNRLFPALFHPAFRIQTNMMVCTMGYRWWDARKRHLHNERERKRMMDEISSRKEYMRLLKLRDRKVRKKMGLLRYALCKDQRAEYEKLFPIDDDGNDGPSESEIEAMRKKQREIERRLAELAVKNPETDEWKAYVQKRDKTRVMEIKKKDMNLRPRTHVEERAERRQRRRAGKISNAKAANARR